jgi:hypothetical protein
LPKEYHCRGPAGLPCPPKGIAQQEIELSRKSGEEKQSQIERLRDNQSPGDA